jgi:beta-aspartyl-peptidase (threonine type)
LIREHFDPKEQMAMTIRRRYVLSCLLELAAFAGPASADAQVASDEVVRSVRSVLLRQVEDWNKGDLDAFLLGYWNSPRLVFQSGGQRFDGWEAMRQRYRRRYQEEGRAMGRLVFAALDIEPLGPEAVLARGRWELTMPDGAKPGGLFTVIFRKFLDGWKIIHDHTSADEPPPATRSAKPARR